MAKQAFRQDFQISTGLKSIVNELQFIKLPVEVG